ncbi:hypothetical protein C1Y40_05441 [Mycobacterium talmoniae]|uniref:Uncharacterized protein n=1 Tax=Mycobacterium talmoniae TaxID=1858794 RepID=A0A2S8BCM3_9MYCO|nr:hypothetical protein C1Y40_05441 [Mycobacterium talmoniae]
MRREPGVAPAVVAGHHRVLVHPGVLLQCGFHLPRLDPHPADLHLVVDATQVLDLAVGQVARQVAGAVHQPAGLIGERVGEEAGGGRVGPVEVAAAHPGTADEQLGGHAHRHRLQVRVEQIHASVGDRPPDRDDRAGCAAPAVKTGDGDRGLGGAVLVAQFGVQGGQELLRELVAQHLAAAPHPAQRHAARRGRFGQKRPQHRRHEMRGGDRLLDHGPDQIAGVLVPLGFCDDQPGADGQRPEDLADRGIERDRRLVQHPVLGGEPVAGLHPGQQVADRAVGVQRALGHAGGTGGVHDVGEVGRRGRRDHRRLAVGRGRLGSIQAEPVTAERRNQIQMAVVGDAGRRIGGIAQDGRDAVGGLRRVQRHERAPGFQHPQQRDDQVGRAVQQDRNDAVRSHPDALQPRRQRVAWASSSA